MEYLIGNAEDPRNWGDLKTTRGGIWAPLEKVVAPAYRAHFIFVQRLITEGQVAISMYIHEPTSTLILVDDGGQNYIWLGYGMGIVPISIQEARTRLVEALLDGIDAEVNARAADVAAIHHYRAIPRSGSLVMDLNRSRYAGRPEAKPGCAGNAWRLPSRRPLS